MQSPVKPWQSVPPMPLWPRALPDPDDRCKQTPPAEQWSRPARCITHKGTCVGHVPASASARHAFQEHSRSLRYAHSLSMCVHIPLARFSSSVS